MKRFIGVIAMVMGLMSVGHADTQGNAQLLGVSGQGTGPYTGNSTFTLVDQSNITSSLILKNLTMNGNLLGNINVTGTQTGVNETLSGYQAYSSVSQVTVSTQVPISPTGSFMLILSTGGPVTFGVGSSYPAISTATAVDGQFLTIGSTSTGNNVFISTSPLTAVSGDDTSIVFTSTRSFVTFIYSNALKQWMEIGKQ